MTDVPFPMAARKSVFVTGAASGIGLAAAKRFAREGWFVGLADIDVRGLERVRGEFGPLDAATYELDVRDRDAWARAMQQFEQDASGRMDVLLNNAGIARYGWLEEVGPEDSDLMVDINIKGVINGAYAGLPLLKRTGGAKLINVASTAGVFGAPRLAVYCATKFAVRGLSESLDAEFARHGVGVACIMPWFIDTAILDSGSRGGNMNLRDAMTAGNSPVYTVEEAADVIWRAVASPERDHMVGKAARQMRFAARWTPAAVRKRMRAGVQAMTQA